MAGLLGETIDEAESLRIGLANRLVDEGDVLAVAVDRAAQIAAQLPLASGEEVLTVSRPVGGLGVTRRSPAVMLRNRP